MPTPESANPLWVHRVIVPRIDAPPGLLALRVLASRPALQMIGARWYIQREATHGWRPRYEVTSWQTIAIRDEDGLGLHPYPWCVRLGFGTFRSGAWRDMRRSIAFPVPETAV